MYTASNWLQPQIYADPNQSAIVTPPNGWGIVPAPGSIIRCPKPRGMGLFDSADFTTWGIAEWGIILAGAYFVISLFNDMNRGVSRVRGRRKKRGRRRAAASDDDGGKNYGPYYKKLSPADQAKARSFMGD